MNDNFEQPLSYTDIIDHTKQALKDARQKAKEVGDIIKGLISVITFFIIFFLFLERDNNGLELIIVVVGLFAIILTDVIVKLYGKNRVLYETLYKDGAHLFNQEQDYPVTYTYKPKFSKEFNKDMGLFTRYSSISGNYETKVVVDQSEVVIKRLRFVTSSGKSTTLHFDGIYIIFPVKGIPLQQYRTNWKPTLKGVKMKRLDEHDKKVYIPKDQPENALDRRLETLFNNIPSRFDVKRYYVASNKKEVHIAFWPKKREKLPKTINYNNIQTIIHYYHDILHYAVDTMQYLDESTYESIR